MKFTQALMALEKGKKIKLPEWDGWWFNLGKPKVYSSHSVNTDRETGMVMQETHGMYIHQIIDRLVKNIGVFTKNGEILYTPHIEKYRDREDWEIAPETVDFPTAFRMSRGECTIRRKSWPLGIHLVINHQEKTYGCNAMYVDGSPYKITDDELFADDWEILQKTKRVNQYKPFGVQATDIQTMEKFIGTKAVKARPMDRGAYNAYRGWEVPANENAADEGYLVEYPESPNKNDERHEGYISWSPKEEFEKAYRRTDGLSFGLALEAAMKGALVARAGWNGKGMFVFLRPADKLSADFIVNKVRTLPESFKQYVAGQFAWDAEAMEKENGPVKTGIDFGAYLCMKAADGSIVNGWLASQTDMLAYDWCIVSAEYQKEGTTHRIG